MHITSILDHRPEVKASGNTILKSIFKSGPTYKHGMYVDIFNECTYSALLQAVFVDYLCKVSLVLGQVFPEAMASFLLIQ